MNGIVLGKSEMALRLAEILLRDTQGLEEFQRVAPLRVEDRDDMWFVTGNGDNGRNQPPDVAHDQLTNETFYMHVVKRDSEVVNFGINAQIAFSPGMETQIRAELRAYRGDLAEISKDRFGKDRRDLYFQEFLYGGVVNSTGAAIQFAELIFDSRFALAAHPIQNLRADLVDGIWHVSGRTDGGSAELVFRRSNAQVISLAVRPIE
jgi:hypothetical protein